MAILNRFSAILHYRDSTQLCASHCGISGDSWPAILGIVRFAIRDSVPLSSRNTSPKQRELITKVKQEAGRVLLSGDVDEAIRMHTEAILSGS